VALQCMAATTGTSNVVACAALGMLSQRPSAVSIHLSRPDLLDPLLGPASPGGQRATVLGGSVTEGGTAKRLVANALLFSCVFLIGSIAVVCSLLSFCEC